MSKKTRLLFLLLVIFQALHSFEEWVGQLWKVFPPAAFVCRQVTGDPREGFIIINSVLLLFGIWCWLFPLRKNDAAARALIWFWIIIELINGLGHPVWAIFRGSYRPGLITAPILLVLAISLFRQMLVSTKDPGTNTRLTPD